MDRKQFIKTVISATLGISSAFAMTTHAAETIKVGILHSLSGTMAISETALKNTALMTIDEIDGCIGYGIGNEGLVFGVGNVGHGLVSLDPG